MRAISMPPLGEEFHPDINAICELLPDASTLDLDFRQPSRDEPLLSHYATEARLTFLNGRQLVVPGYMLWKFLDAIPKELGTDANGYFDRNPFTTDYGENLMRRLRSAYRHLFIRPRGRLAHPPKTARIAISDRRVETVYPKKLPSDLVTELQSLGQLVAMQSWPAARERIGQLVRTALTKPRVVLERYDAGGGYLGQRYVEQNWPPATSLSFENFLHEFTPETLPDHRGIHLSYMQRYDEIVEALTTPEFAKFWVALRRERSHRYELYQTALGISAGERRCTTTALKKALAESQDAGLLHSVVWSEWFTALQTTPLAEF